MNNTDLGRDHRSQENPLGRDTMYTRRNRKWLGLTAMLAVLALVAGACGSDEEAADDGLFKIAVVAPSASNDLAFTQSIVDAVHALVGVDAIDITDGTFIVTMTSAVLKGAMKMPVCCW